MIKRIFDLSVSLIVLITLSPLFLLISLLIFLDERGPIFFSQLRVGRNQKLFRIYKFRSMRVSDQSNIRITIKGDDRVTRIGNFLRKYKFDELPQFFNVLKGDMSIVGPRPEVIEYVNLYTQGNKDKIFTIRPGITEKGSLEFLDEEKQLSLAEDPESYYIEKILPRKQILSVQYAENHSVYEDLKIILNTIQRTFKNRV